jgi:cephalosporin hydroxylase
MGRRPRRQHVRDQHRDGRGVLVSAIEEWVARHWLPRWEMSEVVKELRQIEPIRVVLEVGVHQGDSLKIWRELLDPEVLVGVNDIREVPEGREHELRAELIIGRSQEQETYERVLAALGGREVDFLYIDADHTLASVRKDWEMYGPLVREGGVVVFHDATLRGNPTVEVYMLWPEIMVGNRTKLIHDGNPSYPSTGVGLVFV